MIVAVFSPQQELKKIAALHTEVDEKDYCVGMLNTDCNEMMAVFLLDNYHPNICIDMHYLRIGAGNFLTKRTLRDLFVFCFNALAIKKINAKIPIDNERAISIAHRVGFVHEGTLLKCAFNGNDLWCGGMFIKDCRWLNG